jgi:hypothetical protein
MLSDNQSMLCLNFSLSSCCPPILLFMLYYYYYYYYYYCYYYTYSNALEYRTLRKRRYHLDALFLIEVYLGSRFCPSVLETVDLRVPTRHVRVFPLLYVCPAIKHRPSARCTSAANVVCRDFDIFRRQNVVFYHKQDTYCCMLSVYLIASCT